MKNITLVKVSNSIFIKNTSEKVFNFFSNPQNDKLWRTEINQSVLNETLTIGAKILEYSNLSKKAPNNLIELFCVQFENNKSIVFETHKNASIYLRSERIVNNISDNLSEVKYNLEFDTDIVKLALGFSLPKFIINMKANSDMKKYLHKLKTLLEMNEN